jgi:hypothetical protein
VHRALEGRFPIGFGLHAVNGAMIAIVAALLAMNSDNLK